MGVKGKKFLNILFGLLLLLLAFSVYKSFQYFQNSPRNENIRVPLFSSDTLTIIGSGEKLHLYPENIQYDSDVFVINQIYQGLVQLNEKMVAVPDLAAYWKMDSSRTFYQFFLRKNVRFHNGKPVSADDVIRSIEYFLKHNDDNYVRRYFRIIAGASEFIAGKKANVSGLVKISETVVGIKLRRSSASFLKLLALPEVKIRPGASFSEMNHKEARLPIGSGTYRVTEKTDSTILLEAFRRQPEYPDGAWIKYVKIWSSRPKVNQRYKKGKFDLSYFYITSYVDSLRDFKIKEISGLNLTFIGINSKGPLGKSAVVRQALYQAFHQDTLLSRYTLLGKPVKNISPLYLPNQSETWINLMSLYRVAKQKLFSDASQKKKLMNSRIRIAVDTLNYGGAIPNLLRQGFAKLGIPVEVETYNFSSWAEEINFLKKTDAFYVSWTIDLPDPQFFFEPFFYSASKLNMMNYSNAFVDSLLERAEREKNLNARLNIYAKVEEFLMRDLPIVPLFTSTETLIYRKNLHQVNLSRMGLPSLCLAKVWKEQ